MSSGGNLSGLRDEYSGVMMRALATVAVVMLVAGCTQASTDRTAVSTTSSTTTPSTTVALAPTTTVETAGDPSLAGVSGVTRITDGLDELGVAWRLVDPEGNYIGPVDVNGAPLLLEPIGGYGDFSWMTPEDRFNMDPDSRQGLILACVGDLDARFAQLIEATGSFDWSRLGGQLSQVGMAAYVACDAGLHVPRLVQSEWTSAMWKKAYDYTMAVEDCMEVEAGIDLGSRVTRGEYEAGAELLPAGGAYWSLDDATVQRLNQVCPWSPVGGFGAWNPGDPIVPEP
jgi:hypothetical protein